jgi:anionic cell wall polymer biosynthesis LytR-Cps2A-Psr (LCP) family protein
MVTKTKKKKKSKLLIPLMFLLIMVIIAGLLVAIYIKSEYNEIIEIKSEIAKSLPNSNDENADLDTNFLKALIPDADSNVKVINISSTSELPDFVFDDTAGKYVRRVYRGRRINIAVTGVDARLGDRYRHADANHIISVLLDSGKIEIISIPRDTPADAGYDDTTGQNKLTIVRAAKGRRAYFEELCRIGEVDKIHYFAELGFSQAMGVIEWLGFDKPSETLQILRSRSAIGGDDFQRVYNQGQFMRQMLFRNFSRLDGVMGDIFVGSGLMLIESDLTTAKVKEIIYTLKQNGFQSSIENVKVKIRPSFPANFKVYDFADASTVSSLSNIVKTYYKRNNSDETGESPTQVTEKVYNKLSNILEKAKLDTAKSPQRVIQTLSVYFDQRAWLQISEKDKRYEIRDEFVNLLTYSYEKRKDTVKANRIRSIAEAEDNLLNSNKIHSVHYLNNQ